jgi:spermidine/putrescine-binding protein
MKDTEVIVTTINAVGTVEAANDRATFAITLKAKGDSLEETKQSVEKKAAHALKQLKSRNMELGQ